MFNKLTKFGLQDNERVHQVYYDFIILKNNKAGTVIIDNPTICWDNEFLRISMHTYDAPARQWFNYMKDQNELVIQVVPIKSVSINKTGHIIEDFFYKSYCEYQLSTSSQKLRKLNFHYDLFFSYSIISRMLDCYCVT